MKKVINQNGKALDFGAATILMDDEICSRLHDELAPCEPQEFFTAYETAHAEKYGEEWELSKASPTW